MKLTENFSRWEFVESREALKRGIDNSIPEGLMENVVRTAQWLQILRDRLCAHYGRTIYVKINSGYRCPELNKIVRGHSNSYHIWGLAADIVATTLTPYELAMFIKENMADHPLDKCILEYDAWVHINLNHAAVAPRYRFVEAVTVKGLLGKKTQYKMLKKRPKSHAKSRTA